MADIYELADGLILKKIGEKIRAARLRQNITQSNLSKESGVPLSILKNIEGGQIIKVDPLIRLLRTLHMLDTLQTLIDEDTLTPVEYYELMNSAQKSRRQRANGSLSDFNKDVSEW